MTRTTVCSVPGCPSLIELPDTDNSSPGILRNSFYCDVHTEAHYAEHDNLEAEYEDEVTGALDAMLYGAKELLEWAGTEDDEDRAWSRYVAEQVQLHVPTLKAAVASGEVWAAVRHAMWVGLMSGHLQGEPDKLQLRKKIRAMEPNARRHVELTETRKEGGRGTRTKGLPSDDAIRDAVDELRKRNKHPSWTDACAKYGSQLEKPVSGKTIQNHYNEATRNKTGKR